MQFSVLKKCDAPTAVSLSSLPPSYWKESNKDTQSIIMIKFLNKWDRWYILKFKRLTFERIFCDEMFRKYPRHMKV